MAFVSTPRRSPRLAAIRSNSITATPIRDRLREVTRSTSILGETKRFIAQESAYSSLNLQLIKAEVEANKLKEFLVVVPNLRCYDSKIGPYDAMKVVVKEDGAFSLLVLDKALEEGIVEHPLSSSQIVPVLNTLADQSKVVCRGIQNYSAFKASIGYDVSRAVLVNCPPDSVRDVDCTIIYKPTSSKTRSIR